MIRVSTDYSADRAAGAWGLLAGAFAFGILLAPLWAAPGHHLFGTTEDGLKNYYTALWYVLHDQGLHFTGMNYPFGEHVVFTDNQPLLALALRCWPAPTAAGTVARVLGALNLLMLAAQVLTVPLVAMLLRRCRLPLAYAVGAATVIALLSPQLVRLLGHYALAYSCVVPALWYGLVRAFEAPARAGRWWACLGVMTLLLGCLHPYYLLLSALLLGAYLSIGWWQAPIVARARRGFWLGGVLALAAPLVVFQLGLRLTDPYAPDRLNSPYGFFEYSASVWSVFFPVSPPALTWWQAVFHTPSPTWEGHAYVGMVATVVAGLTLARVARRLRARQWWRLRHPALPPPLRTGLWAATLVLLFAMGWPFRWGLEGLLDLLGPLRQFRSIGRFAWIFYYVFSVYAAYVLYHGARLLQRRGRPALAAAVLVVGGGFWTMEAILNGFGKAELLLHPLHGAGRTLLGAPTDPTAFPARLAAAHRRADEFQAIVPLPFYSLGSEKLGQLTSDESGYYSMRASLETGLPIATAMLSRTALWQAQNLVQLLSAPALAKGVLPLLPNRRPLLVVVVTGTRLDDAERRLLSDARVFYRDSAVVLAELPLAALVGGRAALVAQHKALGRLLRPFGSYRAVRPAAGTYHDDLDSIDDPRAPAALRALPGLLGAAHAVRRGELPLYAGQPADTGCFEASVWVNLRTEELPSLRLRATDARTGRLLDSLDVVSSGVTDICGDWLRLAGVLRLRRPGSLRVWLSGRRFVADAFCLRPIAGPDVWWTDPTTGWLVWNNYPLPPRPPRPAGQPTHWTAADWRR